MAARKVAAAMVDEACAALGIDAAARPEVQAEGENALRVVVDAAAAGTRAAQLHDRLQQALGRLPFKTHVVLA
jgi:fatty-acyl-CoA synthase